MHCIYRQDREAYLLLRLGLVFRRVSETARAVEFITAIVFFIFIGLVVALFFIFLLLI